MDSWHQLTKKLMALPLSERPAGLFSDIRCTENCSDDDSALKLVKCCFWQENLQKVNNEDLFAALWIVGTKVKPKTAAAILRDFYVNARDKCLNIMLFWAWWANYTALAGKRDDAVKICDKGLTQRVDENRHVVEEVKAAIKSGQSVNIPEPTLTRSVTNDNENWGVNTSVTRQQLSKLSLSDNRKVLDRVDVQECESVDTRKNAAWAGSSSKGHHDVDQNIPKKEDTLSSTVEKLIMQQKTEILQCIGQENRKIKDEISQAFGQENRKIKEEISQAFEKQRLKSELADEKIDNFKCDILQAIADLNAKMDAMTQVMVALRDANLQAAEIPLKKKRTVSDTGEGETVQFGANRVTFLSQTGDDRNCFKDKKQQVDEKAPLHNDIPADCDMSMTASDTDYVIPASVPADVEPSMDPENAGFASRRGIPQGLRPALSRRETDRNYPTSRISSERASEKQGGSRSDEYTPESSPAVGGIAKLKPMDRMPRDSVCVRATQHQNRDTRNSRNSDGFTSQGRGIKTSTPFEMCENQPPTLNMSIIAPRGLSFSPIKEEDEAADSSSARRRKLAVGPSGVLVSEAVNNPVVSSGSLGGENIPTENESKSSKLKPRFMNLDHITNPFTDESIGLFFKKSEVSPTQLLKYRRINGDIPDWIPGKEINCGLETSFMACEFVDSGKFGRVFKLRDTQGVVFAAKMQKPPFPWEYYILLLLRDRLKELNLIFDINVNIQEPRAFYSFDDAGILVSKYYSSPTMLNFHNHLASHKKSLNESEIIILLLEFISILETVHKCEILHGDLKPDNVIMRLPDRLPSNRNEFFAGELCFLVLIDFGRSVDMAMFAKNHKFLSKDGASSFTCTQMLDGKPWSYELDFFCMAACFHMLIFGKYMKNFCKDKATGRYKLIETPKRNFNRELWARFFNTALNDDYKTSLLPSLRDAFKDYLYSKHDDSELCESYRNLKKIICQI